MLNKIIFGIKKKKITYATSLLILTWSVLFCGCGKEAKEPPIIREIENLSENGEPIDSSLEETPSEDVNELSGSQSSDVEKTDTEDSYDGFTQTQEEASGVQTDFNNLRVYSEEELAQVTASLVGQYGYEQLDSVEKTAYRQMYLSLMEMSEGALVDCGDSDNIKKIFECIWIDHPELFWLDGYVFTKYTRGDSVVGYGFRGEYTCNQDEREAKQTKIDEYVSKCLDSAPQGDDYEKIKYVYEYIILNTEYVVGAVDNQNICSVFIGQKSVCQGYAKATQYLLNKMGIRCTLVTGTTSNGESHAWNVVYSDGSYYYLDPTWGDASYQVSSSDIEKVPEINYDYLCVTTAEMEKTHTDNMQINLPYCSAMADNFYVRENAYFTSVNEEQIRNLFVKAAYENRQYVTIKCSDAYVYSDMKQYLLKEQRIFKFLNTNTGTISYWEQEDMLTINFWL